MYITLTDCNSLGESLKQWVFISCPILQTHESKNKQRNITERILQKYDFPTAGGAKYEATPSYKENANYYQQRLFVMMYLQEKYNKEIGVPVTVT